MSSFLLSLNEYLHEEDESLLNVPAILDRQSTEQRVLTSSKVDATGEWAESQARLSLQITERTEQGLCQALKTFVKIVETLDMYAPTLKGLLEVHAFVCEQLESLIFDLQVEEKHVITAGYLYGQAMAMSVNTGEAVSLAVDNLVLRGNSAANKIALCILLGTERSNSILFEKNLSTFLHLIQTAFCVEEVRTISREALVTVMRFYAPIEHSASCQSILVLTHALFQTTMKSCETSSDKSKAIERFSFIIEMMPMRLRLDLQAAFPDDCRAAEAFRVLSAGLDCASEEALQSFAAALPILTTWETQVFVEQGQLRQSVEILLGMPPSLRAKAAQALGDLSNVVLDKFEPYMEITTDLALNILKDQNSPRDQQAAQQLLMKVLAALGPVTLAPMCEYLQSRPSVLLADVYLLEQIATLLPNLASRIVQALSDIIDDLTSDSLSSHEHEAVLHALTVFPLDDLALAQRAQKLVLWSLDEEKGKGVVLAALQLATDPNIAVPSIIRTLTFKAAQLLLADDPHVVHVALNVLSNPYLARTLDERSCSMILLALHQSLEPSIQIVAAKLLTHLTTAHRAIVQPLAWSHIRQSLSLVDFLHSVDPTRAIIEACIISNLLPALPQSLHRKYVGPVKELILDGLKRAGEGHTLSLIFQGLANLAKFEGWGSQQQSDLALALLDMTQEIPKDSQHAALNAISKLLSVPSDDIDTYDIMVNVQATFGGRASKLDQDLKALVAGIYGHLGTVERNPVISRDSKAAINRETSVYTRKSHLLSQISEVRDRSGAESQTHINWLVAKNLVAALAPAHQPADERALILEAMTSFVILQPTSISSLIPDLPSLILDELRVSLENKDGSHKDVAPISAGILFLTTALHANGSWMQEWWTDTAEVMVDAITAGEALPVLRGLDIVLDAVVE